MLCSDLSRSSGIQEALDLCPQLGTAFLWLSKAVVKWVPPDLFCHSCSVIPASPVDFAWAQRAIPG